MAAEAERARLARDMHDSLAKTVSGIGFAALALSRRIERDPEGAADEARRLAEDARQATREAREIITGLRADDGEPLPLPAACRPRRGAGRRAPACGSSSPSRTWASWTRSPRASSSGSCARRCATSTRHARARAVAVRLRMLGGRAVLTVADDGAGLRGPRRPWRSSRAGGTSASAACASARSSRAGT